MSEFLPANYEPPKSNSAYMRFEEGQNPFRIMSSPILGWEYWNKLNGENKPVRLQYNEENMHTATLMASKNPDPKDQKCKHFWAMVVWNIREEKIEILQITQKGIQEALRSYATNPKWGSPVNTYDIIVGKEGKGTDTTYTVTVDPKSDTPEEAEIAFNSTFIDLEALFAGLDPFDKNWKAQLANQVF